MGHAGGAGEGSLLAVLSLIRAGENGLTDAQAGSSRTVPGDAAAVGTVSSAATAAGEAEAEASRRRSFTHVQANCGMSLELATQ